MLDTLCRSHLGHSSHFGRLDGITLLLLRDLRLGLLRLSVELLDGWRIALVVRFVRVVVGC